MDEFETRIQSRILDWSRHLPEFTSSHAVLGAHFAPRYLGERLAEDEERLFLLGLTFSFWFWLDDRSDLHLDAPVVDWQALIAVAQEWPAAAAARTPELYFLGELGRRLEQQAQTPIDHAWWRATMASVLESFAREEQLSRSAQPLSYAEYLVVGAASSTVENLLASASLLGGLGLASRHAEPDVARALRYLCTLTRLENDLHSYEKERQEGCLANAVHIMERFMPVRQALQFIAAEQQAYNELLEGVLEGLEPEDPLVWLVRNARASHTGYYAIARQRNSPSSA